MNKLSKQYPSAGIAYVLRPARARPQLLNLNQKYTVQNLKVGRWTVI